jgi:DNA-binding MarR family transcriptional regulator
MEGRSILIHNDMSIIARGGEIFMSRCLNDFGVTAAEAMILTYLYGHEKPRQEDIASFFMLDKGSVAKTLQKLEKKELIERQVNKDDQREKVIYLTEKGYCVQDVCMNLKKIWHDTMFAGISEKDAVTVIRVLRQISDNVTAHLNQWETLYEKGMK